MSHWQMMPSKISLIFHLVMWYQSNTRGKICPSCVNRTGFGETLLLLFPCWWVLFHFGIYGGTHFKEQNTPDLCSWKGNSSYYNSGADHAQILSRSDLASFFLFFAAHWVHLLCFKIRSDLKICQPGASGHLIRTDPKTPVCGINCWVPLELVFLEVDTKYLIIYHNGDFYIFLWIFPCFRKGFFFWPIFLGTAPISGFWVLFWNFIQSYIFDSSLLFLDLIWAYFNLQSDLEVSVPVKGVTQHYFGGFIFFQPLFRFNFCLILTCKRQTFIVELDVYDLLSKNYPDGY